MAEKQIVKVKYIIGDTDDKLSHLGYSYFSESRLAAGDIVMVPARDGIARAQVTEIDLPESTIAAFRDKVKTIPAVTVVPPGAVIQTLEGEPPHLIPSETIKMETPVTLRTAKEIAERMPVIDDPIISEALRDMEGPQDHATALIKVAPQHDPAVYSLEAEAVKLRDYALARVIQSDDDLKPAADDLSIIAKLKKALTEKKAEYLKPIKAHVDSVTAIFNTIMSPLEEADKLTRQKVTDYRTAQEKRRQEAEAINRQKEELALREALFNGTGEITIDTTPVEAPLPVKAVHTDLGGMATMKVTKWELADFAQVPDQYKVLDAGKVTKLVKAGGSIPGIRVWQEEALRVTAR